MEFGFGYRLAVVRAGSEPYCFQFNKDACESLTVAVQRAKDRSRQNGAQSFLIWDPATFKDLALWTFVDGEWEEAELH